MKEFRCNFFVKIPNYRASWLVVLFGMELLGKRAELDFSGKITIEIYRGEKVYINIKDNGIGIKEKNLASIFEQFFTSKKDGDGFGLYMTKLIIEEKMHGNVRAVKREVGAHIQISLDSA